MRVTRLGIGDAFNPFRLVGRLPFVERIDPGLSATLDKCRWIAAFAVLLFHVRLNVLFDPERVPLTSMSLPEAELFSLTALGAQAVMWFFVISGFLVGGKVMTDIRRGRFAFGAYAIDRISRIYIVLLPALFVGYALDQGRIAWHGMSAVIGENAAAYSLPTILGNVFGLQTIFVPTLGSNVPLWSLAFEIWYYVAFPLLMAPLMTSHSRRSRAFAFLLGLACLALLAINPRILRGFAFWLLGLAIRFCPVPLIRSRPAAWILAAVAMLVYGPAFELYGAIMNLPVALTFANALLTEMHVPGRGQPSAIHAKLAGFSYSLYLVHAPFDHFVLTALHGGNEPGLSLQPTGWLPLLWAIPLFAVTVAYGWLFSLLTEAHTPKIRALLRRLLPRERMEARAVASVEPVPEVSRRPGG